MHVTIPYSSGTVETVIVEGQEFDLPVPVYPSSGEITNPGEIAISTLDGYEAICIKSDQNENVLFSDDAANQTKLSSWYNSANGGLSLAQNNDNGPVLSLSEGVPLANQPIMIFDSSNSNSSTTLYLTDYEGKTVDENGYSLTPFRDSEPCAVYNYTTDLPGNLNEMKDIRFSIKPDGSNTTYELTIDNGADIRFLPNVEHVFLCDCVHGLENLEAVVIPIPGSGLTRVYCVKQRFASDITASFADSSQTGCYAVASHAEGSHSTTFAVGSHAEGHNNNNDPSLSGLTTGNFSHCEGTQNQALAPASSVHNIQAYTDSAATASSVYGFKNGVTEVGEFACGQSNASNDAFETKLFSVGDGICIDTGDITPTPTFQAAQCTPHSVFKILSGSTSGNTYYYPSFDLRKNTNTDNSVTRNLVITATVGGGDPQTKTLDEWYEFLTNGGN
jgi:hypothetical protein